MCIALRIGTTESWPQLDIPNAEFRIQELKISRTSMKGCIVLGCVLCTNSLIDWRRFQKGIVQLRRKDAL